MFDIGFWEIFLILVLALVVIGPERLPKAARSAGYWFGRARRFVEGVKSDVESEFDVGEFKRMIHNQEVQINELQRKLDLSKELDLSGDDQPEHRYQKLADTSDDDEGDMLYEEDDFEDALEEVHSLDKDKNKADKTPADAATADSTPDESAASSNEKPSSTSDDDAADSDRKQA